MEFSFFKIFTDSKYYKNTVLNYDRYSKTNTYYNFDVLCWYNP